MTVRALKVKSISDKLWSIYGHVYFRGLTACAPLNMRLKHSRGVIISIWNPNGERLSQRRNLQYARSKKKLLAMKQYSYSLLWGGSLDMTYRELSVFVQVDHEEARLLAKLCGQLAYYYVEDGLLTLIATYDEKQSEKLNAISHHVIRPNTLPSHNLALS